MAGSHSGTAAHKQARARLMAAYQPGQACARCGQPLWPWQHPEADHVEQPHALYPHAIPDALSHRTCNRYAGLVLGQVLRRVNITDSDDEALKIVKRRVIEYSERHAQSPRPTRTSRSW